MPEMKSWSSLLQSLSKSWGLGAGGAPCGVLTSRPLPAEGEAGEWHGQGEGSAPPRPRVPPRPLPGIPLLGVSARPRPGLTSALSLLTSSPVKKGLNAKLFDS